MQLTWKIFLINTAQRYPLSGFGNWSDDLSRTKQALLGGDDSLVELIKTDYALIFNFPHPTAHTSPVPPHSTCDLLRAERHIASEAINIRAQFMSRVQLIILRFSPHITRKKAFDRLTSTRWLGTGSAIKKSSRDMYNKIYSQALLFPHYFSWYTFYHFGSALSACWNFGFFFSVIYEQHTRMNGERNLTNWKEPLNYFMEL